MSNNINQSNNSDEIDLIQLSGVIKNVFKKCLKLIVYVVLFYKKKAILFTILFIIGAVGGYFLEKKGESNLVQEIIIEPKYNSTKYIYDFIEELPNYFLDDEFLKKLKISPEGIKNLKKITIEPIVKATDVLDNLQQRYKERQFYKLVIEETAEGEEDKYPDFYKHHRIILKFKKKNDENAKVGLSIIKYIKANRYYADIVDLALKQSEAGLEDNKVSLKIVDDYLTSLSKNGQESEKGIVVVNDDKTQVITAASLLEQKISLLETLNTQEAVLVLDREVISVVNHGAIIKARKKLSSRKMFLIPATLIGLVSLYYFSIYFSKSVMNFIKE